MSTDKILDLIFIHDLLVHHQLCKPMNYVDLRVRMQTDNQFVEALEKWSTILHKEESI